MADSNVKHLTPEEYLELEQVSPIRHEFVDGLLFAMTGANLRHNVIAGNIFATLYGFLDGTSCRPFMEAFKVYIKSANCFYYPDVVVACSKLDDESLYTEEPILIVEILSASTQAVDRREKLLNYMRIPSLHEYLIVHQKRRKIELYRRSNDDAWARMTFIQEEEVTLESMPKGKLKIGMDLIYKNVRAPFQVQEEEEEYGFSPTTFQEKSI